MLPLFNMRHPQDFKQPHPEDNSVYIRVCVANGFFCTGACLSLPVARLLSRSRLQGTQWARVDTTSQA